MSDKKPPTQYITLKPLKLSRDDLVQSNDADEVLNKALASQVRLSNKKIEILSSLLLLKNQLLEVNNQLEAGQEKLDELQGVAHAGEDESFSMSKNAKQAFDHALATRGNIVGDTLSVIISEAVENKEGDL